MSRLCIQPPSAFALSLAEVKAHLRITTTVEDAYLTALIVAAQSAVETFTARALTTQKWRYSLWGFHQVDRDDHPTFYAPSATFPNAVLLVRGTQPLKLFPCPVASVDSVKYLDETGAEQELDDSLYVADLDSMPALIVPVYGQNWPNVRVGPGAVQVETTNGWDDLTKAPIEIARAKQAMLLTIGDWYENREGTGQIGDTVKALLWPMRVWA